MKIEKIYDRLVEYSSTDYYPFHMPGHKRNSNIISMVNPYSIDITEIDGFDNLHQPEDIILALMNRISGIYGSEKSYLLINGTTSGILAAISASIEEGDEILIGRNCHKSVYNAVYLNRLCCHYIIPEINEQGIFQEYDVKEIERILQGNRKIKAVVITSPTYEGIVSDIEKISEIVHKYNAVLIVDEAHGAHFKFNDYFPQSGIELGADIVLESIHKTLPAMTQTSVMHIASDRVNLNRIERYLSIYQSTSPSYVLISSIERCFDIIEEQGKELFDKYVDELEFFYSNTRELDNLEIFSPKDCFNFDKGKIVIISKSDKLSGRDLYKILLEKYKLQPEMAAEYYVIAMTSICDTKEGFERLLNAIIEIDNDISNGKYGKVTANTKSNIKYFGNTITNTDEIRIDKITKNNGFLPPKRFEAYKTRNMNFETVELYNSTDRISGTYIYLYPPGCPILVPGEVIIQEIAEKIENYLSKGLNVSGLIGGKVQVICEKE